MSGPRGLEIFKPRKSNGHHPTVRPIRTLQTDDRLWGDRAFSANTLKSFIVSSYEPNEAFNLAHAQEQPEVKSPTVASDVELAGEVALLKFITIEWGFSDPEASLVLGYTDEQFASRLFAGTDTIRQRDAEERLNILIDIAIDLRALYRDTEVIRRWWRTELERLGATPINMATKGSVINLVKLAELVEYLSGRG